MIRGFALTVPLLLAGAVAAPAQSHPQHYPGMHPPIDSAQHAALHALMHGSWQGSFSSPHGPGALDLAILHDSLMKTMQFKLSAEHLTIGAATDFALKGDTLQWTQDLSGAPCKASAVVSAATPTAPDTMQGTIACEQGEVSFTLRKKTR
jgi:hypothetical protein